MECLHPWHRADPGTNLSSLALQGCSYCPAQAQLVPALPAAAVWLLSDLVSCSSSSVSPAVPWLGAVLGRACSRGEDGLILPWHSHWHKEGLILPWHSHYFLLKK